MANELEFTGPGAGKTCYVLIRDSIGDIWSTVTHTFNNPYVTGNYSGYVVSATEQGNASNYYLASVPTQLTAAGLYNITAKQQLGSNPAETDPTVAAGEFNWDGLLQVTTANMATSGLVSTFLPMQLTRSRMLQDFSFYMKSASDHISPFTSGVISGQIQKDSSTSWAALQSGQYYEQGQGFYRLQAFTSGDTNARVMRLLFTGVGISGGAADPLPMTFITQPVSGYTL